MKLTPPLVGCICGLILGFFIFRGCGCPTVQDSFTVQTKDSTIYKHDTILVKIPTTKIVTQIKEVVLIHADTIHALANVFKTFEYKQSFRDTNVAIGITDTIFANSIKGAKWTYQILKPTVISQTINKPVAPIKNKVFIGISLNGSPKTFGAGPQMALLTKRDKLFTVGYDIINATYNVGAFIKIHL